MGKNGSFPYVPRIPSTLAIIAAAAWVASMFFPFFAGLACMVSWVMATAKMAKEDIAEFLDVWPQVYLGIVIGSMAAVMMYWGLVPEWQWLYVVWTALSLSALCAIGLAILWYRMYREAKRPAVSCQ